jgi:hypothetical protein
MSAAATISKTIATMMIQLPVKGRGGGGGGTGNAVVIAQPQPVIGKTSAAARMESA